MYLATRKQLHAFIWTELRINDQVISIVDDLVTNEKQPEMTKGCPIYVWIPGIPITDKDDKTQSEEDQVSSTHEGKHDDDITGNGEEEEIIKEEKYEDEHPSDRQNDPSKNIIKNQDQKDQEYATIVSDSRETMIEDEDMEQPEEIKTNKDDI